MRYSVSDIRKRFDPVTFQRGRQHVDAGQVQDLRISDHGHILAARLRDDEANSWRPQVQIRDDQRRFSSRCNCPQGRDCPHVVALLLASLESSQSSGLSQDVSAWVDDLFARHQAEAKAEPAHTAAEEIRFECELPADHPEPHVAVSVRRLNAQGGGKALSFNGRWQRGKLRHSRDRSLFNRLRAFADESPYVARLADAGSGELFDDLVSSGQCYWTNQKKPLKPGKARPAEAGWTVHEDGSQSLGLHIGKSVLVLPLEPPCYVDLRKREVGAVITDLNPTLVPLLGRAPRVASHQIDEFLNLLDSRGITGVPRPQRPETLRLSKQAPQPHLELMHIDDLVERRDGFVPDIYVARLQARYGDFSFFPGRGDALSLRRKAHQLLQIERDLAAERALLKALPDFHDVQPPGSRDDSLILTPYDGTVAWAHFLEDALPRLQEQGWQIESRDSFDLHVVEPGDWTLDTRCRDEQWFELSAEFQTGQQTFNLLELLVELIRDGLDLEHWLQDGRGPLMIDLQDGRLLRLPRKRIEPLVRNLTELLREKPLNRAGRLKLHRQDIPRLQSFGPHWSWHPPEQIKAFADSLGDEAKAPELARQFRGQLRAYQSEGLAWMQKLEAHGFGGVLADDMGLGKTVQTLAHLARIHERQAGRSLIVAPTSVIGNWRAEARRFTPDFKVLLWHGKQREATQLLGADLVITSYATLLRDEALLSQQHWRLIVLDEAQYIKNPRAKVSGCARRLSGDQKLCLSGTPMENHLGELWSLFDFLAPGFLGDQRSFRQIYRKPIEKQGNEARAQQLRQRIQPFLLRRSKDEVAKDLPPKQEILRSITLDDEQAALYESLRLSMEENVRQALKEQGLERSQMLILDALLKLRQVCCDPRLLGTESAAVASSAKLDALDDMLQELIEDGRRILVFSQFTSMLALIEERLRERRMNWLKLTGSSRNRQELVDRFQQGEVPLFLISLKAGGTGLNLTAADTVIHYDPWWNPAVENQATDRAHRIGQDKPVFVYKLICENTVEEKIQDMQERKKALSEQLYAKGLNLHSARGELDLEEVRWLLEAPELA